jgi:hypothetical protein
MGDIARRGDWCIGDDTFGDRVTAVLGRRRGAVAADDRSGARRRGRLRHKASAMERLRGASRIFLTNHLDKIRIELPEPLRCNPRRCQRFVERR